jgi:spore coat polysaccharide biosynthesis protein SpsF
VGFLKDKIGIIIQARMGSTRLPGKIMLDLGGKPVLLHVVERCRKANVDEVIVATTTDKKDDAIVDFCKENNVKYFRGSEDDVLDRYYQCAKKFELTHIIRVTSDCPVIDFNIINELIKKYIEGDYDYASNIAENRTFPRGYDVEVFKFDILKNTKDNAKLKSEKEHVTKYIINNLKKFEVYQLDNNTDYSYIRLTLDEKEDYLLIKKVFEKLYKQNNYFNLQDVLELIKNNPTLIKINQHIEQKKV